MGLYTVQITQKREVLFEVELKAESGAAAADLVANAFDDAKGTMPEEWADASGVVHLFEIIADEPDWQIAEVEITSGSYQD